MNLLKCDFLHWIQKYLLSSICPIFAGGVGVWVGWMTLGRDRSVGNPRAPLHVAQHFLRCDRTPTGLHESNVQPATRSPHSHSEPVNTNENRFYDRDFICVIRYTGIHDESAMYCMT